MIRVKYIPQTEGTRLVSFLGRAWLALVDDGYWSDSETLVGGELECVYAVERGEIVGCLSYHIEDGLATINIVYVVPTHRARGVYRMLHAAFVRHAKAKGARYAVNICKPANAGIQAACARLGYEMYSQEWRVKL